MYKTVLEENGEGSIIQNYVGLQPKNNYNVNENATVLAST